MAEISPTTKLEAVNRVLAVIGEAPVASLSDDFVDAQLASDRIDQESRFIQTQGWHFNTDYEYTLTPNSNNNIIIPNSILRIEYPDYRKYVARYSGGEQMLYDREEQSYTFTEDIEATVIWGFDFEELPEGLRQFLMIRVGRQFQDDTEADPLMNQFKQLDETRAWAAFLNWESKNARYNIREDSLTVYDIMGRYR